MAFSATDGQPASTTNRTSGSAIAAVVKTVMAPLRHTGHGDVIRGHAGCSEPRDLAGNLQCIGLGIDVRRPHLADDDESTIGKRLDRPAPVIAVDPHGAGGAVHFDDPAVHVEEIAGVWIDLRWHVVEDFPVWMTRRRSAGSDTNHRGQY